MITNIDEFTKSKNTLTLDSVMFSFFDLDVTILKSVLSDDGTFCGLTKIFFIARMNTIYSELKQFGVKGVKVGHGVDLYKMPGADVLEVCYALDDRLLTSQGIYYRKYGENVREGERVYSFAFRFNNGKVSEISLSKKSISNSNRTDENGVYLN